MRFAVLLLMLGFLIPCPSLSACPLCKDAISSPSDGDDEINNAPQAYNTSIYLMVGVPYLLLGGVGFFIYRGYQKNVDFLGRKDTTNDNAPE